jgi:DNA translocase FtsK/SpoIIIE-like protein
MSLAREFMSALAMLKQLQAAGEPGLDHIDLPALPTLASTLASIPPVPAQGALLGVASDGMPVMLDLRNPAPGPLLILGDEGSGKLDFLRFTAAALIQTHAPDEVQFTILTPSPNEWRGFAGQDHCLGIVEAADDSSGYALGRLAESIHENPAGSAVLLLVDDLPSLNDASLDVLSWALAEGPPLGLWPLVTIKTDAALEWSAWVDLFHTRIFGRVESSGAAHVLAPAPGGGLDNLLAGAQFAMRSQGHWLRFWVPLAS